MPPPALALVPPVAQTAVARAQTSLRVSYLSEVEDADKQKKWWDKEKGETESCGAGVGLRGAPRRASRGADRSEFVREPAAESVEE